MGEMMTSDAFKTLSVVSPQIGEYKVKLFFDATVFTPDKQAILSPIVAKNGAWSLVAKELLAMSAIHNKDIEKAKSIYQELLMNGNVSADLKNRINDMLAFLNEENQF